jgi:predicted DNA-binding transcriptional regulator AlpA
MTQKLLLSLSDLARFLGVSRPTAYKFVRSTGFPLPVRMGLDTNGRAIPPRWSIDTIETWLIEGANTPERNQAARTVGQQAAE